MITQWKVAAVMVAFSILPLSACGEKAVAPEALDTGIDWSALEPGLHLVLSVPDLHRWSPETPLHLRLHLVGVEFEGTVQSVQGELKYDTSAITLREITFPDHVIGASNESESGRLRFAGVAMEGLVEGAVCDVIVQPRRLLSDADFRVTLTEVIGIAHGDRFSALTQELVDAEHPLLTTQRLEGARWQRGETGAGSAAGDAHVSRGEGVPASR